MRSSEICFHQDRLVVASDYGARHHDAVLARGTFGEVSLALFRDDDGGGTCRLCAVKTLGRAWTSRREGGDDLTSSAAAEITALRALSSSSPYVVSLWGVAAGGAAGVDDDLRLILAYDPVDLYTALEWKRRRTAPLLSWTSLHLLAGDVFRALAHCHGRGWIHRDVKPGNLLLSTTSSSSSSSCCWQMCDFGLAREVGNHNNNTNNDDDTALGTLWYRPPEVLLGATSDHFSVDVYAAGLTLAEAVHTGRPLLTGINDLSQLQAIFAALGTPTITSWPTLLHDDTASSSSCPDWGKLRFTPQTGVSWETLVPRAVECQPFLRVLRSTVRLDPHQRASADDCLTMLMQSSSSSSDHEQEEERERRHAMVRECLPLELVPPVILSGGPSSSSSHHACHLAAAARRRRTFLSETQMSPWEEESP